MATAKEETLEQIAERIARHHLDSERVSVIQFSDITEAIAKALRNERNTRSGEINSVLDDLESDHVLPNLFRIGLMGKQDIEHAILTLKAIRERTE